MGLVQMQAVNGALSSVSICMAYVADKLHPENRAPTFGLIICSFSVGILVGPLGGGYITPPIASLLSLSGVLFCVLYVLFFIPESVTAEASQLVSPFSICHPASAVCPRFGPWHLLPGSNTLA